MCVPSCGWLHKPRYIFSHCWFFYLLIFLNFIIIYFFNIWDRVAEHEQGAGQRERERERERQTDRDRDRETWKHRIWKRLQALSCQHRARCRVRTHKLQHHDRSQSRMLNQLSYPGTPDSFKSKMFTGSNSTNVSLYFCLDLQDLMTHS